MNRNKFLISFNLPTSSPLSAAGKTAFYDERITLQFKMREWCISILGGEEGFPNWQFEGGYEAMLYDNYYTIYSGIYIFDEESRVAFKLKYGL